MNADATTGFIFPYKAKLLDIARIKKDVIRLRIQKPWGFDHAIGQAIALSIDKPGYELEVAPFTLINFSEYDFLEVIVKVRQNREGLTYGLSKLDPGDCLQVSEPWDAFTYKGAGTFIAAGTGIIPFMAIFRKIAKCADDLIPVRHNRLFYAIRNPEDILFENELEGLLGDHAIHVLSGQDNPTLPGHIDSCFLKQRLHTLEQWFYVCGPRDFESDVKRTLLQLGADATRVQTGYNV